MTAQPEHANLPPENHAHPLAEINLSGGDIETINGAMSALSTRRNELAAERPEEIFSGVLSTERGNMLVVVDMNTTDARSPQYVVRTGELSSLAAGGQMDEEYIPDDQSRRTYTRGLKQDVWTSELGLIQVGQGNPITYLEQQRGGRNIGFVSVYQPGGKKLDAVSLQDIFSPVTPEDKIQIAKDALDIEKNSELYPNVNNASVQFNDRRWYPSGRLGKVNSALQPIREALASDELSDADRERLVGVGRRIMQIANDHPENVGGPKGQNTIINPEEAELVAYAEDAGRQLPDGLLAIKKDRTGVRPKNWFSRLKTHI